jgi:HlyD family secretion protein
MTASVDIITEIKNDVVAVPLSAVTTRPPVKEDEEGESNNDNSSDSSSTDSESTSAGSSDAGSNSSGEDTESDVEVVFINDNGTAKKVEVKTGISDYDNIEILEGVEIGQEVVTGPFVVISKRLEGGELIKSAEGEKDTQAAEEESE